jgi:hypothetical protein
MRPSILGIAAEPVGDGAKPSLSRESWSLSKMEGRPKELEPKQNRGEALRAEPEQTGGRPWE